jgi:hypothetical protein
MPESAIYVGRPSPWGNPFRIGAQLSIPGIYRPDGSGEEATIELSAGMAVVMYRSWIADVLSTHRGYLDELRGRDLVCWCPIGLPCHADVLLELANG